MERKLVNGHYKIIVDDNDNELIISMHNNGLLDREIAEHFSVSRQFISKYLQKTIGKREHKITEEDEKIIIESYLENKNQTDVHRKTNYSMGTIGKVLKMNNISIIDNTVLSRKYNVNEKYFDNIDTQNKAYILGLLYSDGCVIENSYSIKLFLQERDKKILDDISVELESEYPLYFVDNNKLNNDKYLSVQNQYGIVINSKYMFNALIKKGVIPRKSLVLQYPDFLNDDFHRHFIRGYFDGDGCIFSNKNGSNCSFTSTDMFCKMAKNIIESQLDIYCGIYNPNHTEKTTRTLQISGKRQMKKFLDWIYYDSQLYLERKYQHYLELFYNDNCESNIA